MAFTKGVGPASGDNVTPTQAVATLTGTTAGRTVIIGVLSESGGATMNTPTCTGEICTLRGTAVNAQGWMMQMADCVLATGGNKSFTSNISGSGNAVQIWAIEIVEPAFYDTSTNNSGTTGANQSVNVITAVNGCLVLGQILNSGGSATVGASYTTMGIDDFIFFDSAEYNLNVASSGSNTVNFTHASGAFVIQGYSWKPAGSVVVAILMPQVCM